MANSETFNVSAKDKKIRLAQNNSQYYFRGEGKGSIDMQIEVFGYNHKAEAKKIYEALKSAGLENSYFKIKIETK